MKRAIGRLQVLTDLDGLRDPIHDVEAALHAGAPVIQVRAKHVSDREFFALAEAVVFRCRAAGAICLIDDRADIALAVSAHGVHVGDEDLPIDIVRRIVGIEAIIGATARDPRSALTRVAEGADYLGVGPTYATTTKAGLPDALGPEAVGRVAAAVPVPVIAIAGITVERVPEVMAAGVHGVAVVGAVSHAADPGAATSALLAAVEAAA
jgi:thiamine-phosphate pyrophosphorylase